MNYKITDKESSYRYERKFSISGLTNDEITSLVNINSSMFNFSFNKRIINNIYFDNFNLNNYHENVYKKISPNLTKEEERWLRDVTSPLEI